MKVCIFRYKISIRVRAELNALDIQKTIGIQKKTSRRRHPENNKLFAVSCLVEWAVEEQEGCEYFAISKHRQRDYMYHLKNNYEHSRKIDALMKQNVLEPSSYSRGQGTTQQIVL